MDFHKFKLTVFLGFKEKLVFSTARLRLYIDCEIISGPGLRAGSSNKEKALQEPHEDVQEPLVGLAPTDVIKEATGIKNELVEEQNAIIEGVQKGVKRLTLKETQRGLQGTTHITETVVPEDSKDIQNQPESK